MNPKCPLYRLTTEEQDEVSYARSAAIEEAGKWCRNTEFKSKSFLASIKQQLVCGTVAYELRQYGLEDGVKFGAVKERTVLEILSSKQALELLECYYRQTTDFEGRFRMNLFELERAMLKQKFKATLERTLNGTSNASNGNT